MIIFPFTINLALDHTPFCFLGHLFLSFMRQRTLIIPKPVPFYTSVYLFLTSVLLSLENLALPSRPSS